MTDHPRTAHRRAAQLTRLHPRRQVWLSRSANHYR